MFSRIRYQVEGPSTWNNLPSDIKLVDSIAALKNSLSGISSINIKY